MNRDERMNIFRSNIKALTEGNEGSFIIFTDSSEKKSVQFAGGKGMGSIICDIPYKGLSKDEQKRLTMMTEFKGGEVTAEGVDSSWTGMAADIFGMGASITSETVSVQGMLQESDIEGGARLTEIVFTYVYQLPSDYTLKVKANINR